VSVRDRRRARRRRMPFVRSAVLDVAGRSHIVALIDLSPEGAFLQTRISPEPGKKLHLRLVLPRSGHDVAIPCRVVRQSERFELATGRPAGLAVAFMNPDAPILRQVEEFAVEGFLPAPEPPPPSHYEYRILDRSEVTVDDLNHLGMDGWRLTSTLPGPQGFRLVLIRRL
jgi:hypothetical protein